VVLFTVGLYEVNEERRIKHMPGMASYFEVGDIPIVHTPVIMES